MSGIEHGLLRLVGIAGRLPPGFEELRAEPRVESYRMLDRVAADWEAGAIRFDRPGERLLGATMGGRLANCCKWRHFGCRSVCRSKTRRTSWSLC